VDVGPEQPSGRQWKNLPPIRGRSVHMSSKLSPVAAPPCGAGLTTPLERQLTGWSDSKTYSVFPTSSAKQQLDSPDLLRGNPELNQINATDEPSLANRRCPPGRAAGYKQRSSTICYVAEFTRPRGFRTRFLERLMKAARHACKRVSGRQLWPSRHKPAAFRYAGSQALETRGLTISDCGRPARAERAAAWPGGRFAPQPRKSGTTFR